MSEHERIMERLESMEARLAALVYGLTHRDLQRLHALAVKSAELAKAAKALGVLANSPVAK
jgi:hypothetical protein